MERNFTYEEACEYLNTHGYIDIENDEDYNKTEIIGIARAKFKDIGTRFEDIVCQCSIQELLEMKERIEKEIRLHDTAVEEGYINQ